jgi:hypothetical protein
MSKRKQPPELATPPGEAELGGLIKKMRIQEEPSMEALRCRVEHLERLLRQERRNNAILRKGVAVLFRKKMDELAAWLRQRMMSAHSLADHHSPMGQTSQHGKR